MAEPPYVLMSCAVSLDGYLDDATPERLMLSSDADLARVDELRAWADVIMVGATTIRRDNPRLLVRSASLRAQRTAAGRSEHPVKATVTATGELPLDSQFFATGPSEKLVYCPEALSPALAERLGARATVVGLPGEWDLRAVVADLGARGLVRIMAEGGAGLLTQLLALDLADEWQLAVTPVLVGEPMAPRVLNPAAFPGDGTRPLRLSQVQQVGDVAVLHYSLSERPRPEVPAIRVTP